MKIRILKSRLLLPLILVLFPLVSQAVNVSGTEVPGVDLSVQKVFNMITGLACWFTQFALIIIVVALVIYGIQFLVSQGNPEKYQAAKNAFTKGLIGVIIILGTYVIIATIANALGADYNRFVPLDCSITQPQ